MSRVKRLKRQSVLIIKEKHQKTIIKLPVLELVI